MSRKVSGVVKQLVVFEKLLSRVMRFHALRANKALKYRRAKHKMNPKLISEQQGRERMRERVENNHLMCFTSDV